jgi:hypothetical protein
VTQEDKEHRNRGCADGGGGGLQASECDLGYIWEVLQPSGGCVTRDVCVTLHATRSLDDRVYTVSCSVSSVICPTNC